MKSSLPRLLAFAVMGLLAAAAYAANASPDVMLGLAGIGAMGITTFVQDGHCLNLDPGATVASGTGHLFGAGLFGVACVDAVSGTASSFITEGVVTIAKTSALAISVGDRVFWDATNSVVNKTSTAQQQVGVAVEAAANPSATVKIKLVSALPVAT